MRYEPHRAQWRQLQAHMVEACHHLLSLGQLRSKTFYPARALS